MIARTAKSAALAVLAATVLGLALPQAAQARDHDGDSRSYGYQHRGHDDRGYRDRDGDRRYAPQWRHAWRYRDDGYRYAPRYYPDVAVYPAPRVYYSAPYYAPAVPVYPSEYGRVGIHLDYNLLY